MDSWRMSFDLHTHTRFLRGKKEVLHATGSMEEVVAAAQSRGLEAVGISNHGPGHVTYGLPMGSVAQLKKERDRLQKLYPKIRILIGVEANIINSSGRLDVSREDFGQFDYVLAGYHYGIFGEQPARAAMLHARNWLWESCGRRAAGRRLTEVNTRLMTEAILNNRPLAVTHPGDKLPCDIEAVAKACETAGTWMEINNFHRDLTVEHLRRSAKYNVKFVIGSDAHCPEGVGCFEEGLQRVFQAGVAPERVVNLKRGK